MAETYTGTGQTSLAAPTLNPGIASLAQGGARLVSLYSAYEQLKALEQNVTIAIQYYTINLTDFNFWASTYGNISGISGNGRMSTALTEGMQRPFYAAGTYTPQYGQLDYLASTGRGQSRAQLKVDREWFNTRRRVSKYNVGQGHRVDLKFALARFNGELEGWNLGFRFEDNRKMQYDEQRHAHQAEILNIGIGAGNAARQGLATAVRGLSEAKTQKAGQYAALSNGLSTYAGFQQQTQGMKENQQGRRAFNGSQASGGMSSGLATAPQRTMGTDQVGY